MAAKKYYALPLIMMLAVILVSGPVGCNGKKTKLCCAEYEATSDRMTYCNNHRTAVVGYITDTTDVAVQKARFYEIEDLYEIIQDCTMLECIELKIYEGDQPSEFSLEYKNEHKYAEEETSLSYDEKPALIICGFNHALEGLRQTLMKGDQ